MTDDHQSHYRAPAVAVLAAGVLAEAARLFDPWPGFSPLASRVVSIFLITLWLATAVAAFARRRLPSAARIAWALAFAAPLAMFVHGAVTRVGGSSLGLIYLVAAVALGFLLKRSFLGSGPLMPLPSRASSAGELGADAEELRGQ